MINLKNKYILIFKIIGDDPRFHSKLNPSYQLQTQNYLVDLSFPHRVHLHHFLAGSHHRLGRKQFDLNFHLVNKPIFLKWARDIALMISLLNY
ncbi:hypothetical protein BpHYR1_016159 [Brachionus plicatilis]|uniref:Uncharacterized protein n=1 Tax=Brachionus plicatilis TaxID=10195 RepID=A0A3M7RP67_BRAPC|nr:hypothetical protein BpHYR1_016159 [Brachionus plicatilis]